MSLLTNFGCTEVVDNPVGSQGVKAAEGRLPKTGKKVSISETDEVIYVMVFHDNFPQSWSGKQGDIPAMLAKWDTDQSLYY
jgi:hypothetical protein